MAFFKSFELVITKCEEIAATSHSPPVEVITISDHEATTPRRPRLSHSLRRILEYSPLSEEHNSDVDYDHDDESDEGIFFSQTKYQSGSENSIQYEDCEIQMIFDGDSTEVIDQTNDDKEKRSDFEGEEERWETIYSSDWSFSVEMEEEMEEGCMWNANGPVSPPSDL
jgi:hypothetical protein